MMRVNWCAALVAAVLGGGNATWALAQDASYVRPVSLEVIEAGASVPCEGSVGPGCAVPAPHGGPFPGEPGCALTESPTCGTDLGAGCDGGCDDGCCCTSGWIANVESVFLFADRRGHNAYTILADIPNLTANQYDTNKASLEGNLLASPRTTIGYQGDCWGVVARYWSLNDTATDYDPFLSLALNDPSGSAVVDRLKLYTFDVEATRQFCYNDWDMNFTAGARYADWEDDFRVDSIESINVINLSTASALAGTEFHGLGITGALGGYRRVNCCSGLGWFWNARGSYLFGRHESFAEVAGASVDATGQVISDNAAFTAADGNTFIGEFQIGAQWTHDLKCVPAQAFVRIAGEFQYWGGQDVAQSTAVTAGASNLGGYLGVAEAGDPNMSLYGFNIGAGISY